MVDLLCPRLYIYISSIETIKTELHLLSLDTYIHTYIYSIQLPDWLNKKELDLCTYILKYSECFSTWNKPIQK